MDGQKAAGRGSCAASEDAFARQVGFPEAGGAPRLGLDPDQFSVLIAKGLRTVDAAEAVGVSEVICVRGFRLVVVRTAEGCGCGRATA